MPDPINQTWEQITASSGSFLQDAINFVDDAFRGTLSDYQKNQIDAAAESDIYAAANGNIPLAQGEITQYKADVTQGVYSSLPSSVEDIAATLKQYAPWIIGGIILIYALPLLRKR